MNELMILVVVAGVFASILLVLVMWWLCRISSDCSKTTDTLHNRRCADCVASDTGPSADRMHDNRDRRWMADEIQRDADAAMGGRMLHE